MDRPVAGSLRQCGRPLGSAARAQAMTMAGIRPAAARETAAMGWQGAIARPYTALRRRLGMRNAGANGARHAPWRTRGVIVMPDTPSPDCADGLLAHTERGAAGLIRGRAGPNPR